MNGRRTTNAMLSALLLSVLLFVATANSPKWCGIAERGRKCGGGTCEVEGWLRRCTPSCSRRTVKCGTPIGGAWRVSRRCDNGVGCMANKTNCSVRCQRRSRRRCVWRQRMRWRTRQVWRHDWKKQPNGKRVRRWVRHPIRRRALVWVSDCNPNRYTICSCWANPCQCQNDFEALDAYTKPKMERD